MAKSCKKGEKKNATITTAVIVSLLTVILTTPISKITDKAFDKLFEDTELKELEKEKLRLEIKKLKSETSSENIQFNSVLRKKKSNFYEKLNRYEKIESVSYIISDENKNNTTKDYKVEKINFKDFILSTDDLDSIEKDNSIIEIISPVLKKGRFKWTGFYKEEPISFSMKSTEFKNLVQKGEIEFKNGSSINCLLLIKRKMDNEGKIINNGYEVLRVNEYFENDKPIETKEGKHHRRKKEAEKQQLNLFANLDDEDSQ